MCTSSKNMHDLTVGYGGYMAKFFSTLLQMISLNM